MADVTLRLGSVLDMDALLAINAELQALHFAARPDQFKPVDLSAIQGWLLEDLADPAATLWVAALDGVVVGAALVTSHERAAGAFSVTRTWWILDLVGVLAAYRRRGIARALIDRVVTEARTRGVTQIELNSWEFNRDAQAAFRSLGFLPKYTRFELAP